MWANINAKNLTSVFIRTVSLWSHEMLMLGYSRICGHLFIDASAHDIDKAMKLV